MVASLFSPPPTSSLLKRIGRETIPALVPSSDVDYLRTSRSESGFLNVYASRHVWVAKVKEGGRLTAIPGSRQPTPQQSAAFVVAWYKARFGKWWILAIEHRKRPYWKVVLNPDGNIGWAVQLWNNGVETYVNIRNEKGRPTSQKMIFTEPELASLYARKYFPKYRSRWAAWAPPRDS